jgi:hypothetical protein
MAFAAGSPIVLMSNLNNPRGLAIGPDGAIYVAEAGKGGSGPCVTTDREGQETSSCYGASGAVSRYFQGKQERIITGLPSLAGPDGGGAAGPQDVAVLANGDLDVVVGLGGDPASRSSYGDAGADLGELHEIAPDGTHKMMVDIAAYETQANPAGGPLDSNPYGIFVDSQGPIIADAGGNSLLRIGSDGKISTIAAFPNKTVQFPPGTDVPMEPVPTSVTAGPDGTLYVGQLTGFPFPVGGASVFKVTPGQEPSTYLTGFTNIIDLTFGPDGNLYVLEITKNGQLSGDPAGALYRIAPDGTKTEIASDGLAFPSSVAISPDGKIYVSNNGVAPGGGQVVVIPQAVDLDQNGKKDVQDVVMALRALVGATTLTPAQASLADVNADGKLDLQDVRILLIQAVSS